MILLFKNILNGSWSVLEDSDFVCLMIPNQNILLPTSKGDIK